MADTGTALISRRHPTPEGEGGQVEDPLENEVQGVDELEGNSIAGDSVIRALEDDKDNGDDDEEEMTEEGKIALKFFKCPACLSLLHEAAVFGCGHIMCVECTGKWITRKPIENLVCPICKMRNCHVPRKCELIGGLVQKLKPLKNETKETEEAKKNVCRNGSFFVGLKSKEVVREVEPQKVQLKDVICFSCKGILYEPSVLNCGHVFCISCVLPTNETTIKCKACGALHASAPKICLELNGFIDTYFPSEYRSRVEQIQIYTGTSSFVQTMRDDAKPLEPHAQSAKLSETHVGIGCDSCGVYPIQGNRYSCQSCEDFDLCEKCSKMDCTIHGRSGQLHSVDHILELNDSYLFEKVLSVLDEKIKNAEGGDERLWEAEEDDDVEELREWQADTGGVNAGFFWQ